MSDGFPSVACADAILSHGEVVEVGGRFPASDPVFCRDRKTGEVQTHLTRGPKVLWRAMREAQSIAVPLSDGGRPG